jgi:hypothetical protein
MKNYLLTVSLLFISLTFAQSDKNVEEQQFKINFINPGLEYELGIAKNQTITLGLGLQFSAVATTNHFYYAFLPAINAQYRYFYNMDRRLSKDKTISGNSGNYLAASATMFTADVIIGNIDSGSGTAGFVGPVYGIQRTYRKGFNFNLEFGVGLYFASDADFQSVDTGFGPTLSFSLGWVLGKNKNR